MKKVAANFCCHFYALYKLCSEHCACLAYFERVERHTSCKVLEEKTNCLLFEKSHHIRNSFRSEIKDVVSYIVNT